MEGNVLKHSFIPKSTLVIPQQPNPTPQYFTPIRNEIDYEVIQSITTITPYMLSFLQPQQIIREVKKKLVENLIDSDDFITMEEINCPHTGGIKIQAKIKIKKI